MYACFFRLIYEQIKTHIDCPLKTENINWFQSTRQHIDACIMKEMDYIHATDIENIRIGNQTEKKNQIAFGNKYETVYQSQSKIMRMPIVW